MFPLLLEERREVSWVVNVVDGRVIGYYIHRSDWYLCPIMPRHESHFEECLGAVSRWYLNRGWIEVSVDGWNRRGGRGGSAQSGSQKRWRLWCRIARYRESTRFRAIERDDGYGNRRRTGNQSMRVAQSRFPCISRDIHIRMEMFSCCSSSYYQILFLN